MTRPTGSKHKESLGPRKGLHLRISEQDRAAFDAAAERAGVKTSEWARTVLRREAGLWTGQRRTGTMTTIEITDRQIATIAEEAAAAGDDAMVEICERALGAGTGINASDRERRDARAECARVIAAAEAMRDE